jgi:L-rhamnose mutarotase
MPGYAFKMFLNPGEADEYRRRRDAIWPELQALLRESGVRNYSIFSTPTPTRLSLIPDAATTTAWTR